MPLPATVFCKAMQSLRAFSAAAKRAFVSMPCGVPVAGTVVAGTVVAFGPNSLDAVPLNRGSPTLPRLSPFASKHGHHLSYLIVLPCECSVGAILFRLHRGCATTILRQQLCLTTRIKAGCTLLRISTAAARLHDRALVVQFI